MDRVTSFVAVASLILGGVAAVSGDAPEMKILLVAVIVGAGVVEWWRLRQLGKETRDAGNRLLFLVGMTLISMASF
jgi:hypothetical protein